MWTTGALNRCWLLVGLFIGLGPAACAVQAARRSVPVPRPEPKPTAAVGAPLAGPPDSDGDGIPDDRDKCPDAPENYNGCNDEDGCPDTLIRGAIWRGQVQIADRIYFSSAKADIDPISLPLLALIAATINATPVLERIEVRGYAAANEQHPKRLAEDRANVVAAQLMADGVSPERLVARSLGAAPSLCGKADDECFGKTRRVDFFILARKPEPAPVQPVVPPGDCLKSLL
jgi:outer membrane protein OmpA-like peptidoglycan-associated protein